MKEIQVGKVWIKLFMRKKTKNDVKSNSINESMPKKEKCEEKEESCNIEGTAEENSEVKKSKTDVFQRIKALAGIVTTIGATISFFVYYYAYFFEMGKFCVWKLPYEYLSYKDSKYWGRTILFLFIVAAIFCYTAFFSLWKAKETEKARENKTNKDTDKPLIVYLLLTCLGSIVFICILLGVRFDNIVDKERLSTWINSIKALLNFKENILWGVYCLVVVRNGLIKFSVYILGNVFRWIWLSNGFVIIFFALLIWGIVAYWVFLFYEIYYFFEPKEPKEKTEKKPNKMGIKQLLSFVFLFLIVYWVVFSYTFFTGGGREALDTSKAYVCCYDDETIMLLRKVGENWLGHPCSLDENRIVEIDSDTTILLDVEGISISKRDLAMNYGNLVGDDGYSLSFVEMIEIIISTR